MKHQNIDDLPRKHKRGAEDYEFIRRDFMKVHEANTLVRVYELPPGKSAYPYHYHLKMRRPSSFCEVRVCSVPLRGCGP